MNIPDIKKRLLAFRKGLNEKSLDAALITKRENCLYLSGFTGDQACLIITQQEAILVTDFRYREQATAEASDFNVIQYEGDLLQTIVHLLKDRGIKRLGFEENSMPFSTYNGYVLRLGKNVMFPLEGLTETLRMCKDQYEIEILKKAAGIADKAFDHILNYIKPGVAELEIAAELEYFMKKMCAKGASFEIIVASGKRSSMPHGAASEKKLEAGDAITLDFGAIYSNYCSDMTRTVFLGNPGDEMKRVYDTVLEAQLQSLEGAHRGRTGKEIDAIARDIINRNGYEGRFGHGLGHGVGLEIHEEPRLSPTGVRVMENGMVVTVEPGIYIEGTGGVRIEDMIIINNDCPVVLTHSTKDMIIL